MVSEVRLTLSRRHFFRAAGAAALGFAGLERLFRPGGRAGRLLAAVPDGFGPLVPDPDGLLDLPEGFRYTVLTTS